MEPHAGRDAEQTGGAKSGNEKVEKKTAAAAQSDGGQGKEKDKKRARAASPDSEVEYVEEKPKAPDIIKISDSESDYSGSEEDERGESSDSDWDDIGTSARGKAKIKVGNVTIEAFCVDVDDEEDGSGKGKGAAVPQAEPQTEAGVANEEVRNKIRKMLQLGLHPDTPDAEAQQALKNANRFLTRYNLSQVDLLKGGQDAEDNASLAGGMKVVKLRSKTAARKCINNAAWISNLGHAVSNCFDCCYYTQHGCDGSVSYVFYGVATNSECAGYGFCAAFNRITVMTANYCGEGREARSWQFGGKGDTANMRANYRDGLVAGLKKAVVEEKAARKKEAKEREERRQAEMEAKREAKLAKARAEAAALAALDEDAPLLAASSAKAEAHLAGHASSDDAAGDMEESDDDAPLAHKWRAKAEKQHTTSECQALVILEQHCEKVAEKVLEKAKIKLQKGAALRGTSAFDRDAYRKGQEDAKQIDIKQRGIDNKPAASGKRGSSKKRSV